MTTLFNIGMSFSYDLNKVSRHLGAGIGIGFFLVLLKN